jgi:hypothetical protein
MLQDVHTVSMSPSSLTVFLILRSAHVQTLPLSDLQRGIYVQSLLETVPQKTPPLPQAAYPVP